MPWYRNPDWVMVVVTTILAAVGVGTGYIFYQQFQQMSTQTGLLNTQAQQASKDAVSAAENTQRQLVIAEKQATAARDSVNAIRKQMRQDQRAWLNITSDIPGKLHKKVLHVPVTVVNTGKTAATHVTIRIVTKLVRNGPDPVFDYDMNRNPYKFVTTGAMWPNVPFTEDASVMEVKPGADSPTLHAFLDSELADIDSGEAFVITYVMVTYRDIFNIPHWSRFCAFSILSHGDVSAKKCTEYNNVDGD